MANLDIVARVLDKTKPGLRSAEMNVGRLEGRVGKFGKIAGAAALGVAGIGVAGAAVGLKLVGNFLESADAIGKMATSTGIGVEELQKLDFALQQGGSSVEKFEKGIQTFAKGLNDAATKGTGPVADGLEQLGLNVADIEKLSPDEQFRTIAQAISEVENPTLAAALAQKLFGGAGRELLPTLKEGRAGLAALSEEAERNGKIMSTETVRGAEEVNDAINSAKNALSGLATGGFQLLLPHIRTAVFWFKDVVVPVIKRDVVPQVQAFAALLAENVAPILRDTVIPSIRRLAALFGDGEGGQGEGLRKALNGVRKAVEVVLPIIAAVAETNIKVVVALLELTIKTIAGVAEFLDAVFKGDWGAAWGAIGDIFANFVDGFTTVFRAGFDLVVKLFDLAGIDIVKTMKTIANGVIGFVEAIPNAYIDAINAIVKAWNNFSLGLPGFSRTINLPFGKTFKVGFEGVRIDTPDIPTLSRVNIPRLQAGGIVTRPTLAEIGEAGPEAVVPLGQLGRFTGGNDGNIVLELDGEKLGEYVINRVNVGSQRGELNLASD